MVTTQKQMDLFSGSRSLNATHEIKRQIRLALAASNLSREQIVDKYNDLAGLESASRISKAALDSWTKDSDPGRMPSLLNLNYLCEVLDTLAPYIAAIRPLGAKVVGPDEIRLLNWAKAEQAKRSAAKKAKLALMEIE